MQGFRRPRARFGSIFGSASAWRNTSHALLSRTRRGATLVACRSATGPSFAAAKELPSDFDACWEVAGVDAGRLDRELLDFSSRRAAQKARYGGELFPAETAAEPAGTTFLDYFQRDRDTDQPKGIIAIDLGALP
jgi:hypothetical protein